MKNMLKLLPFILILMFTIIFKKDITGFIIEKIIYDRDTYTIVSNKYAINYNFLYIKKTDNFIAKNKTELISILYTGLNSGNNYFYFFCNYDECENDIATLTQSESLQTLNNYVHPYNSFQKLSISIDSLNKVGVTIDKVYSNNDINAIDQEIKKIMKNILTDDMTDIEKITAFHDYIIDNTKYDTQYIIHNLNNIYYPSHNAIGPLFYNKALCGGYASVMAIFLNELNLPNYRISSEEHIWNLVNLNNKWYHIDLTWDDPITSDGSDLLLDIFLLIDTKTLESLETGYHIFDKTIYLEANQTY